jgi:hypothetical protein
MVEIHDRIAMHAEKTIRIEQRLEVFHASPSQMGRLPHMQSNVSPCRLHPSDIFDPYQYNLSRASWTCLASGSSGCAWPEIIKACRPRLFRCQLRKLDGQALIPGRDICFAVNLARIIRSFRAQEAAPGDSTGVSKIPGFFRFVCR